jgi:O-antigen/teichoic acid export membrane protein
VTDRVPSVGLRVASNTTFAMLDMIVSKVGTTAVFVLLVRLLSAEDVAAIGIATGYLVFISFLDVAPIRALLRDYPSVSSNRRDRDELLTGMFAFWALQTVAMLLLCLLLQNLALSRVPVPGIGFLFLAVTVDFIAQTLRGWVTTVLYADFQQAVATKVSFVLTMGRLASYGLIALAPALTTYAWLLIVLGILSTVTWATLVVKLLGYAPVVTADTPKVLWRSISSYGLWDHGNRMAVDTLFMVDTVVLSWFGQLADIAAYTIALRVNSLLFLVPQQLSRSLQLMLSHAPDDQRRHKAINVFLKWNTLISMVQMVAVIVAGGWLLRLLFGVSGEGTVLTYTVVIAAGVALMNFGWPLVAVINNLCSLRRAFLTVYLPALLVGVSVYVVGAARWGGLGVAWGNVVAYTVLFLGLALFVRSNYRFSLAPQWLSVEEKGLISELFRGRPS